MKKFIIMIIEKAKKARNGWLKRERLKKYDSGKRIPWSVGYEDYKWNEIASSIRDEKILSLFKAGKELPRHYGKGLDERIVEYTFVFSRLAKAKSTLLDAGSTFNFEIIISQPALQEKEINIFTYYPENWNFVEKRISYQFGDLKDLPYRNEWFDEIACISTLEHIGMDNTLYGYQDEKLLENKNDASGYQEVIKELLRVLKPGGQLFLTFPFGKKKNYGFFQQFDSGMLEKIHSLTNLYGNTEKTFFKYTPEGWIVSDEQGCSECESFNPHTGEGKGTDGAAHSRGICAIHFKKNKS